MAGRIRSIKPELIEDAVTAGLSHVAFRLFVGMIVLADDHGNLRVAQTWLMGQIFHGRPVTARQLANAFAELARVKPGTNSGLITVYEVEGQMYAHLNGWKRHQRIDNAMAPRVPIPPGWECVEDVRNEGNRKRIRWNSRKVVSDGAAPPAPTEGSGAAPLSPTHTDGAAPAAPGGEPGAARSPITDHRSPIPPTPPLGGGGPSAVVRRPPVKFVRPEY
jgi:hypothetical protein